VGDRGVAAVSNVNEDAFPLAAIFFEEPFPIFKNVLQGVAGLLGDAMPRMSACDVGSVGVRPSGSACSAIEVETCIVDGIEDDLLE
jgi:hypothetical protein